MAHDSLYGALGITPDATAEDIDRAYRRTAQRTHPDREGGHEAEFIAASQAYEVLGNPTRRAEYDRTGATKAGPTVEQEAIHNLEGLFLKVLDSEDFGSPTLTMASTCKSSIAALEAQQLGVERKLRELTALQTKLTHKGKSKPVLLNSLALRVQAHKDTLSGMERGALVLARVAELIEEYEYTGPLVQVYEDNDPVYKQIFDSYARRPT